MITRHRLPHINLLLEALLLLLLLGTNPFRQVQGRQIDLGPYIIDYHQGCGLYGSTLITQEEAQAACKVTVSGRGGPDWNLATIPSQKAYDGIWDVFSVSDGFIGAKYDTADGKWKWQYGRLAGVEVWAGMAGGTCLASSYKYPTYLNNTSPYGCVFPAGEPSGAGYCMTMSPLRARSCTYLSCYLCERTMCRMGTDCFEPHTASMDGTVWPHCSCNCKPGKWGNKCQYPMVYDHGPNLYVSEFATQCDRGNYNMAVAGCRALGPEWGLATFPSTAVLAYYKQMMSVAGPFNNTYVGASDDLVENRWVWTAGRLNGVQFWQGNVGGSCVSYLFPAFLTAVTLSQCGLWMTSIPQPDNSVNDDCAILYAPDKSMLMGDVQCSVDYTCYTCERSPCKIGVDCYGPNTLSISGGYFPFCTCNCQFWAWGTKCEFPIVYDHGASFYVSEYASQCTYSNFTGAQQGCRSMGPGWDLATFPSLASLAFYKSVIRGVGLNNTFVGASDQAVEGKWVWVGGRLKGVQFWQGGVGGSCVAYPFPSFLTPATFPQCGLWLTSSPQPDNSVTPLGRDNCGLLYAGDGSLLMNDVACAATSYPCYACERSPCKLGVDCHPTNTKAMLAGRYFPHCQCQCILGYTGPKCQRLATATMLFTKTSTVTETQGSTYTSRVIATPTVSASASVAKSLSLLKLATLSGRATASLSKLGTPTGASSLSVIMSLTRSDSFSRRSPSASKTIVASLTKSTVETVSHQIAATSSPLMTSTVEKVNSPSDLQTLSIVPSSTTEQTQSKNRIGTVSLLPLASPSILLSRTHSLAVSLSLTTSRSQSKSALLSQSVLSLLTFSIESSQTRDYSGSPSFSESAGQAKTAAVDRNASGSVSHSLSAFDNKLTNETTRSSSAGLVAKSHSIGLSVSGALGSSSSNSFLASSQSPAHQQTNTRLEGKTQTPSAFFVPTTPPTEAPNGTTFPPPMVLNAPDFDDMLGENLFQGAMQSGSAAVLYHHRMTLNTCRRMELLLVQSAILTPLRLQKGWWGFSERYANVLYQNGIILCAALMLGLVSVLVRWALFEVRNEPARRYSDVDPPSSVTRAMVSVRFPATFIQAFLYLASGTAVAAGLSLSDRDDDKLSWLSPSLTALVVLAVVPVGWTFALRICLGNVTKPFVKVAEDEVVAEPDTDNNSIKRSKNKRDMNNKDSAIRVLRCAEVRPCSLSKRFGPIVGDLRFHTPRLMVCLFPMLLPWALLVSSFAVGLLEVCEHLPVVVAAVLLLYAALVSILRPFLGITHNALEVLWSLVATGLLIVLWLAFSTPDGHRSSFIIEATNPQWVLKGMFSDVERTSVLALGCILSCRYPFVLARALDVVLPKVVEVKGLFCAFSQADLVHVHYDDDDDDGGDAILVPVGVSSSGGDLTDPFVVKEKASPESSASTGSEISIGSPRMDADDDEDDDVDDDDDFENDTDGEANSEAIGDNDSYGTAEDSIDSDIL